MKRQCKLPDDSDQGYNKLPDDSDLGYDKLLGDIIGFNKIKI